MEIEVVSRQPDAFSEDEQRRFCELVGAGGEVNTVVLQQNVLSAKALTLAKSSGQVLGVAALKFPKLSYRKKIAESSGFNLPSDLYPFELGYVFVQKAVRGHGLSHRLLATTLIEATGNRVFATARTDNLGMLRALERAGFARAGKDYPGRRDGTSIRLLIRNS